VLIQQLKFDSQSGHSTRKLLKRKYLKSKKRTMSDPNEEIGKNKKIGHFQQPVPVSGRSTRPPVPIFVPEIWMN